MKFGNPNHAATTEPEPAAQTDTATSLPPSVGQGAARVNLTKYVNLGNGKSGRWRFCPVARTGIGRIRPDYVLVEGRPELHREGSYYMEWYEGPKRRRETLGKDAVEADAAVTKKAHVLRARSLGLEVILPGQPGKNRLDEVCRDFLSEVRQQNKPKTHAQYKTALAYFRESTGDKCLGEIERKDLIRFMGFLSDKGLARRTISNKVQFVMTMLKANGVRGLLNARDWPRYIEPEPEVYTVHEIDAFLKRCDDWQRVLFEFFWMTGLREAEVQYATWADIDLENQVVRVTAKPRFGFTPKTWEEREVPLPNRLCNSIRKHQQTTGVDSGLLFTTSTGHVVHSFLRQCKSIARRAGLNCGQCQTGQGHCSKNSCCERWFLHKFRATFATMHLRAGVDLSTVQKWMGHKDLASTMRYLKPARGKEVLVKVNRTFPET